MSLASELQEITSNSFEALHSSTLDLIKTYLIDEMKQAAKKGWTYGFTYATVIRKLGVSQNKLLDKNECLRRLKEWQRVKDSRQLLMSCRMTMMQIWSLVGKRAKQIRNQYNRAHRENGQNKGQDDNTQQTTYIRRQFIGCYLFINHTQ